MRMHPFTQHDGIVAWLARDNVDTDQIIPKQFLKSIDASGYGDNLFDAWRYLDRGEPGADCAQRARNPDFALNQPQYAGASILLAGANFGCGSSREHAVWALLEYGFRTIIAPSFAEIFAENAGRNGLLLVRLPSAALADLTALAAAATAAAPMRMCVDLQAQTLVVAGGAPLAFTCDAQLRQSLLLGKDDIDMSLELAQDIRAYERRVAQTRPWG